MSPSRRRDAVRMLQDRLGLSERRACLIAGQHRSTQRRGDLRIGGDDGLRRRLREISVEHPRWGYRKAWSFLRQEGVVVNRKKIQRLWREERPQGASPAPQTSAGRHVDSASGVAACQRAG